IDARKPPGPILVVAGPEVVEPGLAIVILTCKQLRTERRRRWILHAERRVVVTLQHSAMPVRDHSHRADGVDVVVENALERPELDVDGLRLIERDRASAVAAATAGP